MRTLLAVHLKSKELSFWEMIDLFIFLAYLSLAASRTLLERLLSCLNFTLDSKYLFYRYKQRKWFMWVMAALSTKCCHIFGKELYRFVHYFTLINLCTILKKCFCFLNACRLLTAILFCDYHVLGFCWKQQLSHLHSCWRRFFPRLVIAFLLCQNWASEK